MSNGLFEAVYVMGKNVYVFRGASTDDLFDAVIDVAESVDYDFGREEAVGVSISIAKYIATGNFIDGMFDADFIDGDSKREN